MACAIGCGASKVPGHAATADSTSADAVAERGDASPADAVQPGDSGEAEGQSWDVTGELGGDAIASDALSVGDSDAVGADANDAGVPPAGELKLLYTRVDLKAKTFAIVSVSPDGSGASQVLANAAVRSQPAAGRMVAGTGSPKSMALEVLTIAGKPVAVVAPAGAEPIYGVLNAEGTRVAWTRLIEEDGTELAVRDLGTGLDTVIPVLPAWETRPDFSPDGKWLAWYGDDGKLYVANGDGTAAKAVLAGIADDNDFRNGLAWAKDSQRLAVTLAYLVSGEQEGMNIGLFDVSAGKLSVLTKGAVMQLAPAFASDEAQVYFTEGVKDESADLRRVAIQGGKIEVLTDGKGFDFLPQPSPDGKLVAFARWTVGDNIGELRVLELGTGKITVLDSTIYNRPYWFKP